MKLYNLLKVMSSESKAQIIAKFLYCDNCHQVSVNGMCSEMNLKQANLSKHLMELKRKGIIHATKDGRKVIYSIDKAFESE